MTRFEAIEASRKARGEPDPTAVKQPEPTQPARAWKRSIYAWLSSPRPPTFVEPRKPGFQGMTPERRAEISRKANAARSIKVSAKRRSEIAAAANAARFGK